MRPPPGCLAPDAYVEQLVTVRDIAGAVALVDFEKLKATLEFVAMRDPSSVGDIRALRAIIRAAEAFQLQVAEAELQFSNAQGGTH